MYRCPSYFCGLKFLGTIFLMVVSLVGWSQDRKKIVDDSTKQVYGPKTVEMTNERLIKNNIDSLYTHPDTTVYQREFFDFADTQNRRFQSLGFFGSPSHDLEYDLPSHPGRTLGINGYDRYFKDAEEINYYDTKSPFMDLGVVLGGQNRSIIDFGFSRNVNPNLNVGFDIYRITADKQIALERDGDRQTQSANFDIYAHYRDEAKPYEIAFSFATLKHQVSDFGGVDVPDNPATADFYLYKDSDTQLVDARTVDRRSRVHLFHQYRLGSGFQAYHQANYTTQQYKYSDPASNQTKYLAFYPQTRYDTATSELSKLSDFTNEVGLKGDIKGAFYRFYAKHRALIYNTTFQLEQTQGESYLGTYLRFDWKDKFSVSAQGEISDEGAYQLEGKLESDLAVLSYTSQRALPSFVSQSYDGNHHQWNNSFNPIFSNRIKGELNLKWNVFEIAPRVSFMSRSNHIYMDESAELQQISSTLLVNTVGGSVSFNLLRGTNFFRFHENEYFRFENTVTLQTMTGPASDVLRAPDLRYHGRFFWRGDWWQNAVPVEFGVNLFYRSAFFAYGYDPVLSQFRVQNDLELQDYMSIDFFVNMKIRSLRAYVKWVHINQQVNDGYMTTPYYPGQKTIIDLGIQWLFFD